MDLHGIDEIDNKILDVLNNNARLGYTEIGKAIGLSRVAVRNRVENLEKKGIIKGYKTLIDSTSTPGGIKFFVDIETMPELYESIAETLSRDSRIRQIYSMTGACKIHALGFAPSSADVGYFARNLYKNTKGVKRLEWNIVAATLMDVDGGVEYVVREDSRTEYMEGRQQVQEGADKEP